MAGSLKFKIKMWISNKAEECKAVAPLYSFARDRKLSLLEKIRVRFHLLTCDACANYVTNLQFMHEVFHIQSEHIEAEKLQVTLSPEAKERIKQKLKSND
jgi:hypothetical protein